MPTALSVRRADPVKVIGIVLVAKAAGNGLFTIAALMGQPVSTVRRWLRQALPSHTQWLYVQAVQHAFRLHPDILVRPSSWPNVLDFNMKI